MGSDGWHRLRRSLHRYRRPAVRVGGGDVRAPEGHLRRSTSSRASTLLRRLQAGEVDLGGREAAVRKVVDPHLLAYNDTWDKIDAMLEDCMSASLPEPDAAIRRVTAGSTTGSASITWTTTLNPRRRDIGYHNIFDHYRAPLRDSESRGRTAFPLSSAQLPPRGPSLRRRTGGRPPTACTRSSRRRVIDRQLVPGRPRAGLPRHPARQPLVPRAVHPLRLLEPGNGRRRGGRGRQSGGLDGGRWGDWRRAPATWEPYHPVA